MRAWLKRQLARQLARTWLWYADCWKASAERWNESALKAEREGHYELSGQAIRQAHNAALRAVRCVTTARQLDPSATRARVRA